MPYVLMLLFEDKRYKRDAVVRVYADDRLVDEISLDNDINTKLSNYVGMPSQTIGPVNKMPVNFLPEKIFLFEIDEQHLHDSIQIEVNNSNTNYTNGFMTEFSYFKFLDFYLFPKCLFEYKNWISIEKRFGSRDFIRVMNGNNASAFPRDLQSYDVVQQPNSIMKDDWREHSMGGNFSLKIPLSKKYSIIHLGRLPPKKMYLSGKLERLLWKFGLLNMSI